MIYMFFSNNPSSEDINSSNLPCLSYDLFIYSKYVSFISYVIYPTKQNTMATTFEEKQKLLKVLITCCFLFYFD